MTGVHFFNAIVLGWLNTVCAFPNLPPALLTSKQTPNELNVIMSVRRVSPQGLKTDILEKQ